MTAPAAHGHFSADWLALREVVDARSRSLHLTSLVAEWLARRPGVHDLVDLGCGSGSNLQFLAPRLPGPQRWRLIDHDAGLLTRARHRQPHDADGARVAVETHHRNLALLDDAWLAGTDLVTASALLDLVSRGWVEALVAACARHCQAMLFALSVDGDWAFVEAAGERIEDDEDARVRSLFQAHQCRDKGLGAALGGEAPAVLARVLSAAGYRLARAATPWHLAAGDPAARPLAEALVRGWHTAAREQAPHLWPWLDRWLAQRLTALARGQRGVMVGHVDLFAWPGVASGAGEGQVEEGVVAAAEGARPGATGLIQGVDGRHRQSRAPGADQQWRHQQMQAVEHSGLEKA
jgi:SAM-dependent methyltransferase